MPSKEEINKFKENYKKGFKKEISDEKALELMKVEGQKKAEKSPSVETKPTQTQSPQMGAKTKISPLWLVVVVIFIFGGAWLMASLSGDKNKTTSSSQPAVTQTPSKPLTLEEKVRLTLTNVVGNENIEKVEVLDSDPSAGDPAGTKTVYLTYKTKAAGRSTFLHECIDIFQNEFAVDGIIYLVGLHPKGEITDIYGKTTSSEWAYIRMSRPTNDKIDYANFDYKKLPIIADQYTEKVTIK